MQLPPISSALLTHGTNTKSVTGHKELNISQFKKSSRLAAMFVEPWSGGVVWSWSLRSRAAAVSQYQTSGSGSGSGSACRSLPAARGARSLPTTRRGSTLPVGRRSHPPRLRATRRRREPATHPAPLPAATARCPLQPPAAVACDAPTPRARDPPCTRSCLPGLSAGHRPEAEAEASYCCPEHEKGKFPLHSPAPYTTRGIWSHFH